MASRAVAKESKAPLIEQLRSAIRDGTYVVPSRELAAEFARAYYARTTSAVVVRSPLPFNFTGQLIEATSLPEADS